MEVESRTVIARICKWCRKEYDSKGRLKSHQMKRHAELVVEQTKKKVDDVLRGISKQVEKKRRKASDNGSEDQQQVSSPDAPPGPGGSREMLLRQAEDLKRKVQNSAGNVNNGHARVQINLSNAQKRPKVVLNSKILASAAVESTSLAGPSTSRYLQDSSLDTGAAGLVSTASGRNSVPNAQKTIPRVCGTASNMLYGVPEKRVGRKRKRKSCPHCPFVAKSPSGLKSHVERKHTSFANQNPSEINAGEQGDREFNSENQESNVGVGDDDDRHSISSHSSEEADNKFDPDVLEVAVNNGLLQQCPVCNKPLPYNTQIERQRYKEHVDIHRGLRPFVCPYFNECGRSFADPVDLLSHTSLSHDNQEAFECDRCGRKFTLKQVFTRHQKNCKRRAQSNTGSEHSTSSATAGTESAESFTSPGSEEPSTSTRALRSGTTNSNKYFLAPRKYETRNSLKKSIELTGPPHDPKSSESSQHSTSEDDQDNSNTDVDVSKNNTEEEEHESSLSDSSFDSELSDFTD